MDLGRRAEEQVAKMLERRGFRVIGRNVRVGRLEIDIIAGRDNLVVFCEVRSRSNDHWITPAQTIDYRKIKRLRCAAARWLSEARIGIKEVRFDAASVVYDVPEGRVNYYEGAF
jgi:putative endonuclease